MTRLAGGSNSASPSVNGAKSGLHCSSSNPNGTIFPLNTVTLSRMPPLEYDAPPVCVAVPACGLLRHMLISFLITSRLQIPFHIPTRHHTLSRTTKTTIENFHSLHWPPQVKSIKISWNAIVCATAQNAGKTTISPIFHIIRFQSILPPKRKKNKKNSSGQFFEKKQKLAVCASFSGVRSLLWSTMICE